MEIKSFVEDVEHIRKTLIRSTESAEEVRMVDREMGKFQRGYAQKWNIMMAAHSSCFSTMIAGSSKFPARQAKRASDAYDKRSAETTEYKERAINAIIKKLKEHRISAGGGEIAMMEKKLAAAEAKQVQMKAINKIIRKKKLSDDEKAQQIASKFNIHESTARKLLEPDFGGRIGYPSYKLTNNNANIKRMKERVRVMAVREDTPTAEIAFAGGTIIDSNEEDRVQIYFDETPDAEMRSKLKSAGWHWSPSNGVWQRKRTAAAMGSAKQIVGIGWSPSQQTTPTVAPEPAVKMAAKPAPTPATPPALTAPPELAGDVLGGGMGLPPTQAAKPVASRAATKTTKNRPRILTPESEGGKPIYASFTTSTDVSYKGKIYREKYRYRYGSLLSARDEVIRSQPGGSYHIVIDFGEDAGVSRYGVFCTYSPPPHPASLHKVPSYPKAAKPAPTPTTPPALTAPPELAGDVLGAGLTPTQAPKPKRKPAPAPPVPPILTAPPELAGDVLGGGMGLPPTQAAKRKGKKAAKPKVKDKVKLLGEWGHIIEVRVDDVRIKPDGIGDAAVLIYIDMLHKVPYKPDPIAKMSFYWQVKPRTAAPTVPPILTAPPELAGDVLGGGMGLTPTQAAKPKRKQKQKPAPAPMVPPILMAPPELTADLLGGGMGLTPTQAPEPKPAARTAKKQPKKTAAAKTKKTTKKAKPTAAKPKAKKTAATPKLTPSQQEYLAIQGFVMVKRGGKYVRITN